MASSVVAHHDGPVLLHSTYPVGRTVCADEVGISGGGMPRRGNSAAAQRETERVGHRRRLEMGGEGSPGRHPAVRALPCGQREMAQFFRQKMTQPEIVF